MKLLPFNIPITDLIYTTVFLILILFLLFFLDKLSKIHRLSVLFTRKSVHLLVGLFIVLAIYILNTVYPILILSVVFFVFDWWAIKSQRFQSIHPDKNSYGTVYYPLAVFVLSLILWESHKPILITSILIMAVADIGAAVVGERYAKLTFIPFKEKKSMPGSAAMFLASLFIVIVSLFVFYDINAYQVIIISFVVAVQVTAAEMISARGSDNLSVPVISALFLYLYLNTSQQYDFLQITFGTFLALIIGIASYYFHFLRLSGVIAVILMGGIIFGIGGFPYALPILFFFISSSILSFIKKGYKQSFLSLFEKSATRDIYQVFANGGIATIIILSSLVFQAKIVFLLYLTAVAAAVADTWATELGVLSRHKPRLLTTWEVAERGTSGAISLTGSIAALIGSSSAVLVGFLYPPISGYNYELFFIVAFCGVFSSFIDSILGATIQSQYLCTICKASTEKKIHCYKPTQLFRGFSYIKNDTVNIISIISAVLFSYFLIY